MLIRRSPLEEISGAPLAMGRRNRSKAELADVLCTLSDEALKAHRRYDLSAKSQRISTLVVRVGD